MKNRSNFFKVILTIFVFGFVIWLGGTVVRTAIAYNLFTLGTEMQIKTEYSNIERMNTIYLFSTTALITGIAYGFAAISSIILVVVTKKELKQRGWLFIAFCLFVLTIPVQLYFFYMDYSLATAVYYQGIRDFYNPAIQQFFVKRFTNVANASLRTLLFLFSFTCMLYSIWRPLEKDDNDSNSSNNNFPKNYQENDSNKLTD
jgi:hypothetical protein